MPQGLHRALTTVEYFTFGFGTMIGVGWLVLMDDWLGRGGPAGAMLGFAAGTLLLLPIGATYARLVRRMPDAGAEVAYTEGVFPRAVSFIAGWTMVLAYAIVCPWEAVAIGNLLARVVPAVDAWPLYELGGRPIYAPRLALGWLLTAIIGAVNYRGIRPSGLFQDVTTFGLLAVFALFAALGFAQGEATNLRPLFPAPGWSGALVGTLLVLQIVPYFMTGFESVAKGSEEARDGYDPRGFGRAIVLALAAGGLFYVTVVAVVAYVFPWTRLVEERLGTEAAFERAFASRTIARIIIFGALLSLLKVFNGNFVAATRLLYALGRRGLVPAALGRVHPRFGTPAAAIVGLAVFTAAGPLLGDALLVPVTEVGSLASGIGWLAACAAFLAHTRPASRQGARPGETDAPRSARLVAALGVAVGCALVVMKIVPLVPGSFGPAEWTAFALWSTLGAILWFHAGRGRRSHPPGR
jgi:APA family basic amino acid/polyamine antiporter